jgi:hypothetical protein
MQEKINEEFSGSSTNRDPLLSRRMLTDMEATTQTQVITVNESNQ